MAVKDAFFRRSCQRLGLSWLSEALMSPRGLRRKASSEVSTPVTPNTPHFSDHYSFLTTPTTPDDDDQRWSEIVPPKGALTFAPVWDPDHDTVRFSGAQLLNAPSEADLFSPSDAVSQVLTVGNSTLPLSEPTSTLQYFHENYQDYLFSGPLAERKNVAHTQTSSTLDGLDVYLRGSLMVEAHKNNRYYSCLDYLDQDFDFDPRTSFARHYTEDEQARKEVAMDDCVSDEGFYEVSNLRRGVRHERLRPSNKEMRTAVPSPSTAIAEFMSITDDDASSQWSAVDAPESPAYAQLVVDNQQRNSMRLRRLQKKRPSCIPAHPAEVLQREIFSHQVSVPIPPAPSTPSKGGSNHFPSSTSPSHCQTLNNFVTRLSRKKSSPAVERWMCVEVTQDVRQTHAL